MKILITVKTYPTLSKKYNELVCTAGFCEDGRWIRIYPIRFRQLDYANQYHKYEWIELDLEKNKNDFRPESYHPVNLNAIPQVLNKIETENNWQERKTLCLKKVYDNLTLLINEAKDKNICTSLAVFKPQKVINFIWEEVEREWDDSKIEAMKQLNLFEKYDKELRIIRKLPYKFSYVFEDIQGKKSTLMIEDWEIGALYWNCLKQHKNEEIACEKVKQKYFNKFTEDCDLYFFLGTTLAHHFKSKNPFIIVGVFYPPKEFQTNLF